MDAHVTLSEVSFKRSFIHETSDISHTFKIPCAPNMFRANRTHILTRLSKFSRRYLTQMSEYQMTFAASGGRVVCLCLCVCMHMRERIGIT